MAVDATHIAKCYGADGGDKRVTASGGTDEIQSGGTLDRQAGSKMTQPTVAKAADFTLTAADSGTVFVITAADKTVTLPATALGLVFTFVVKTLGGSTGFSISPVAADNINAGTDNKDLINSSATDAVGDSVTIVGDGDAGWLTVGKIGTWAAES